MRLRNTFRFALWIVCLGILIGGLISAPPKSADNTQHQNKTPSKDKTRVKSANVRSRISAAPCSSSSPTTPITAGQTVTGQLSGSDCTLDDGTFADRYSFNGTAGQQIAISLNSSAFDAYLFLLDADEELVEDDDDSGGGTNSRIPVSGFFSLPTTGRYIILANAFDEGETGSYTLSLTGSTSTATVVDHRMTGSVTPNSCSPIPTAKTTFALTDEIAYQWASYSGINNGDVIRWDFIQPNGSVFQTSQDTFNFSGGGCAWEGLRIAGQPAALLPGNWQVRVSYNGSIILTENFTISGVITPTTGGAVIIDGTDADDHGEVINNQNVKGWLYMQKVLENLATKISPGTAKVVVDLGTTNVNSKDARDAIQSAFDRSFLPGNGWRIEHVDTAANITAWLTNLSTANTGILCIPTYNLFDGDLESSEMAAINAQAIKIADYINRSSGNSGALFAMGEAGGSGSNARWGWLRELFPGVSFTDRGTGGVGSDITLTPDGMAAFPELTNADLELGTNEAWHNYFTGNLGTLKVLATAPDGSNVRSIILGGVGIIVPKADLALTQTVSPNPVGNGADLTFTMTVSNSGTDAASEVVVTDNLPANVAFVSCNATGGGVCGGTGNNRTVAFNSLAAGASATVTIVSRVNCTGSGASSISNTASVASATNDPNANNNSATASTVLNCGPNRTVRIACPGAAQNGTVRLPIELVSEGNENALSFSLNFDPAVLTGPQVSTGSDATSAMLNTNTSQVAQGRIGIALALATGQTFSAGTRQILVVTFTIVASSTASSTVVDFGDTPIRRVISNANAQALTAGYQGCGTISIVRGIEADVMPPPNGDGAVTVSDWVKIGRFAARLDLTSSPGEFQRADCAPRDTKGDGSLDLLDWVQAGRYAAGLDPLQSVGGPSSPLLLTLGEQRLTAIPSETAHGRELRASSATFARGRTNSLTIELDARGNENAVGFSLNFSPSTLQFVSATLGSGASGALLIVNSTQVDSGRVGIAVALPAGQKMAAGTRSIVIVNFSIADGSNTTMTAVSFDDLPIKRQAADADAATLDVEYIDAVIKIANPVASVSAASFGGQTLAREAIAAAFGQNLATTTQIAATSPLPTALAGTTVKVTDSAGTERLAPLFFVSPAQINYLIPEGSAAGAATVMVTDSNGVASFGAITLANAAPGLFTANASGQGLPAAIALRIRADGSQSYESVAQFDPVQNRFVPVPIDLGAANDQVFLLLFGTGWRYRSSLSGVGLKIGGLDSQVSYAGPQGGFVGLDQINALLPRGLDGRGEVEIALSVDGVTANTVRLVIR